MSAVTKRVFVTSALWKMLESLSTKGTSLIISIILARLLLPKDYGIVAISDIFISFSGIVIQNGLSVSLIRKTDADELDYSNALFLCLTIAAICYVAFWILAPAIADYYNQPILVLVLRVQMLLLFLTAFSTVTGAVSIRQFRFRDACVANLLATIIGGGVGIILAYCGRGVWALIVYTLVRDLAGNILLYLFIRWKIILQVSYERIKTLVSFSWWLLWASILDFGGNNIYNTVFGKRFSAQDLGYRNKGYQLPELLCLHTYGAISNVLLPAMAEQQNDNLQLKKVTRKLVSMSSYIIFPMMAGLTVTGNRLIIFLFTDKWLPCVPILWAACLNYSMQPFRSINMQLMNAFGDSKIVLLYEVCRFTILAVSMTISIAFFRLNIYGVSAVGAVVMIIVALITQGYAKKKINYGYLEWLNDMAPTFLVSLMMSVAVYFIGFMQGKNTVILFIQIGAGVAIYVMLSMLFCVPAFKECLDIVKDMRKGRE